MKSLVKLTSRTTHGLCRAVNVTGTAASVVTGGVFKLAGAAVLDAVGKACIAQHGFMTYAYSLVYECTVVLCVP